MQMLCNNPVEVPSVGNAFQLALAGVFEAEARARD